VRVDSISHCCSTSFMSSMQGWTLKEKDAHKTTDANDFDLLARAGAIPDERAEDSEPGTEHPQT
jgi:hypothetical protein